MTKKELDEYKRRIITPDHKPVKVSIQNTEVYHWRPLTKFLRGVIRDAKMWCWDDVTVRWEKGIVKGGRGKWRWEKKVIIFIGYAVPRKVGHDGR